MMADNRNKRLNRSLTPEVIGGSDPVAEYDKREAGGTIGVVAGMLIALPSEAWHNILPEVGQQAIIFGGTAVAIGGLWQISQAVRLREYSERKSELLREAVDNLPPPVGSIKDSSRWLDELFGELDQKRLAYEMAVKTGRTSAIPLTTDEAERHAALVRLTSHCSGGSGLVNRAAAQVLHWAGCALPPEMTAAGRRRSRREAGHAGADSMHQTTLDMLEQYVPLDGMTWREYVASPEFAAVCGSAQQIDRGLRLQTKPLGRRPADCFSHFSQYRPREDNWW
ncbi:hypothetical protein FBF28_02485 [Candidatus Saccharibacteria bacterium oral taxon 488]|nr:hypothetical protein FBF28_02485 [Candidatus Saccharibacteria bacterium oral taxon 488]